MTDNEHLDELASAYLDGVTTPDEAARVEADPALQARVDELRRVRAAVGAVPPADAAQRELAITAALAAFAEVGETSRRSQAAVTPLAPRRGPSPQTLRFLGAAAAIAVVALLVSGFVQLTGSRDDTAATRSSSGGATIEGSASPEIADAASGTTTAPASALLDLGDFDDVNALAAALPSLGPVALEGEDVFGDHPGTSLGCDDVLAAGQTSRVARTEVASATVSGERVIVVVNQDDDGSRTLLVYRVDGCEQVAERSL